MSMIHMFGLQRSRTRWSAERKRITQRMVAMMVRFNGAALVGVRRAFWPRQARAGTDRFNGAALVGVRRGIGIQNGSAIYFMLQRSRTRWSAESKLGEHAREKETLLQRSRTRWSAESWKSLPRALQDGLLQRSRTRWSAERRRLSLRVAVALSLQRSRTRWSAER